MSKVQLLNRQIEAADMGFCSVHEHTVPLPYSPKEHEAVVEHSLYWLKKAYETGVRTVVDVSAWCGAEILKDVVDRTPMQLVGCTGFYLDLDGTLASLTIDDFFASMMRDVECGLKGSELQPGVIKIASAHAQLTSQEERLMTAAGMVQKRTGLPVCIHSIEGIQLQQRLLTDAGADPSKLYFCHVEANQGWEGRSFDEQMQVFDRVVKQGSYLCFNNFGNWQHTPEDCMAGIIRGMSDMGYGDRMLATMDYFWYFENGRLCIWWEDICEDGSDRDCSYLVTHVQPWMRRMGIDEKVIHAMNHENPARLFG